MEFTGVGWVERSETHADCVSLEFCHRGHRERVHDVHSSSISVPSVFSVATFRSPGTTRVGLASLNPPHSLAGCMVVEQAVEDSVDERGRLRRAVTFGKIDGLVDGHRIGRFRVKHFKSPQPQNIPIGRRHSAQAPVRRGLFDQRIQMLAMQANPGHQAAGEFDQFRLAEPAARADRPRPPDCCVGSDRPETGLARLLRVL